MSIISQNSFEEVVLLDCIQRFSDGQISAFVVDFESRLPKYLRNALHHENKAP